MNQYTNKIQTPGKFSLRADGGINIISRLVKHADPTPTSRCSLVFVHCQHGHMPMSALGCGPINSSLNLYAHGGIGIFSTATAVKIIIQE